jgi:hypothetical protein
MFSLLFISFFQIPVIESIPSKLVLHINKSSTIAGAANPCNVQYTQIQTQAAHPANPHILLEDTPERD